MNMSMDLDAVKYTDLQRLAKDVGLKANMKADKLLKALKEFYQQQQEENKGANADEVDPVKAELREVNARSPVVASSAFITKRRGRGQKAKRKQPEDEEDGAEAEFNTAEDIAQSEEKIEEGSNKKRRLSEGQGCESGTQEEKHTKSTEKTEVKAGKEAGRKSVKPSKIPRHDGFRKTESRLKPTTPNFKKLHEAHFSKMESIDSYVQRKAKQMAVFRNSVKELKLLSEKAIPKSLDKKPMKPNVSRASLFSPVANGKRQSSENRKLTRSSTSKPVLKDTSAFKPTVLSTCKMNVRFSQTTQDNEHKRSLIKTPARMSPHVALTSTPGTLPNSQIKPAVSSNNLRTPGTFVFNGNASSSTTPGTNKKNAFDLKASLSRPLTYQPHKGKLKPFGMTQENTSLNKSQTTLSQQKNYKQHQVQTREDRRVKHKEDRKQKKEKMLRARRGLVMA